MSQAIPSVRHPASGPIALPALTNHISSPVKQSKSVQGRETVQFSVRNLQQDNKFHDHHLNQLPPGLLLELQQLTETEEAWFENITASTTHENGNYKPLSQFLTSLSTRIYSKF